MPRARWVEDAIAATSVPIEDWEDVDTSTLSRTAERKYKRRRQAIELYLRSEKSVAQIVSTTGISKTELYRHLRRVFAPHADGHPIGFAALIPQFALNKRTGPFQAFLEKHPTVHKSLQDRALAKKEAGNSVAIGRYFTRIWLSFRQDCLDAGLDPATDYPLNTKDSGREAVRRFCKKIRKEHFKRGAIADHGGKGGRFAAYANTDFGDLPRTRRPYERVQLDAHRIDSEVVLSLADANGEELELPMSRVWLLVLIDCASRAILGYHVSLNDEVSANDVLACIAHAFEPWKPLECAVDGPQYSRDAGLPSGVVSGCAWRCFDAIQMDNAMAHRSTRVHERLVEICGEIILIRPGRPRSNAFVERFMRTFEELGFHFHATSVGSNPKDPRRRKPDVAAAKLRMDFDELLFAVDVVIANYNGMPHSSLSGRSPNAYLRFRAEKGNDLIRTVMHNKELVRSLHEVTFRRIVRGGSKSAHRPYINYKGARYSSQVLALRPNLLKQKLTCVVSSKDVRVIRAYEPCGRLLGDLVVESKWMGTAHSLRTREAVLSKIRDGLISRWDRDPLQSHTKILRERASLKRRDRNRLLKRVLESGVKPPAATTRPQPARRSEIYPQRNWIRITKVET